MIAIDPTDAIALAIFVVVWLGYTFANDHGPLSRRGLSSAMNRQRRRWMAVLARRDLRMIDTAILAGLQQGTAFFASGCIFAIGGCFALLGSADRIAAIAAELPFEETLDRPLVEVKLLGLVMIFAYAFFKFGWAYRLFNYCSILIGAIPMLGDETVSPEDFTRAVERAGTLNQLAGMHFNAGLRAVFFALGYLGWFLGPYVLIATTFAVLAILANRQFYSAARKALD